MKLNFFSRASRWQLARFSMAILSALAISPGLLGFAGGGCVCETASVVPDRNRAMVLKMIRDRNTGELDIAGLSSRAISRVLSTWATAFRAFHSLNRSPCRRRSHHVDGEMRSGPPVRW